MESRVKDKELAPRKLREWLCIYEIYKSILGSVSWLNKKGEFMRIMSRLSKDIINVYVFIVWKFVGSGPIQFVSFAFWQLLQLVLFCCLRLSIMIVFRLNEFLPCFRCLLFSFAFTSLIFLSFLFLILCSLNFFADDWLFIAKI